MGKYTRITATDRDLIGISLQKGLQQKEIADILGKSQSSISRELKKGLTKNAYSPLKAQNETIKNGLNRRPKILIDDSTWLVINSHLSLRWSPKQIEQYLRGPGNDGIINPVSEKTIYNYIHFHMKGELKKLALAELRQKGKKRSSGKETRGKIPNMTLIDDRPEEISGRLLPGHWEGDLIIGKDHKSALSVIVERKTRFVMIDRLLTYDAKTVRNSIEKRLKSIDPEIVKSLTCDQGKEMAQHEILAEKMKLKVYFCHPHSPWEKGTCENTNFLIRDMLGGITDFREISQQRIHKIADMLNERPRQTLGFKTPNEEITKICNESY